ncbi:MAG TPA: cytochrome c oxidase assembly protein [Vicinamibacterales bacterium]
MLPVALAVVAALLFAQGMVRLRRRGRADIAGWDRAALFGLGLAVTVVALVGPIDRLAETKYLSVHMLQHVLIGDLAPALMIVAVRGPLLVFLLPAQVLASLARSTRLRAVLSTVLQPRIAFGLWAANLAIWHVPYLYDLALRHDSVHYFEHACWVVAGLIVWTLLVDPGSHRRLTVGGRIALAAAMFAAGQVLADVLVFSFHPLYPPYPGRTDQQLAGIAMMAEQLVTLGTLAFALLRPRMRAARLVHA